MMKMNNPLINRSQRLIEIQNKIDLFKQAKGFQQSSTNPWIRAKTV